jgi:O-acetyl-ADP-ribose deacetylase (regulator of RNase III)
LPAGGAPAKILQKGRTVARIRIEEGDLTAAAVDAIVNAANTQLQMGEGVSGAILRRGGPSIQEECSRIAPIDVGEATATRGGDLPAEAVIHAVTMEPGGRTSEEIVRSAARRALEVARDRGVRSIAFPALGAGAAGLTLQRSAEIILEEARRHFDEDTTLEEVWCVLLGEPAYRVFEQVRDAESIRAQLEKIRR